jgi:hypothetical protein
MDKTAMVAIGGVELDLQATNLSDGASSTRAFMTG